MKTTSRLKTCALFLATLWAPFAHGQGKWVDLAPFPDPREEVMGEAANGKLYVFAGLIPLWHPAGLVYEYEPAANKWTKKKPMELASHHVAFCEHNGRILAASCIPILRRRRVGFRSITHGSTIPGMTHGRL